MPDDEFIDALHHSADVFSAFRTHRMQNDIAAMLVGKDGKLKSFSRFSKDVQPYVSHHNMAWLRTEYDTAVLRAHQAADWQQFEAEKDVLPNLEWMPSTSVTPGADHRVFWGTVMPIDDRFWTEHRPGDRWNCKCQLRSTDKPVSESLPQGTNKDNPHGGLENNPGKDKNIFSDKHPYFPKSCVTCPFSGNKLMALLSELAGNKKHCMDCRKVEKVMEGLDKDGYKTVPTDKGKVRIHPKHGKNESEENKRVAKYLANKHGYKIDLLPRSNNGKEADTYNRTLKKKQEYKVNSVNSKTSIDNLIRDAKKQAGSIVLVIDSDISYGDLKDSISDRIRRSANVTDITLIRNGKDATYGRKEILSDSFKIQQEDFK